MATENSKLSDMLSEMYRERIKVTDTEKFAQLASKHGFEHISHKETGSFVVMDTESKKYFRVDSEKEFVEIEKP